MYWHATTVIGFTGDADIWCRECAALVYDRRVDGVLRTVNDSREGFAGLDFEGNPTHPIFVSDEGSEDMVCNRCNQPLMEG